MSLSKRFKSRKLQSLVVGSILAESHYIDSDSSYNYTSLGPVKGDDFLDEQLDIIKDLISNVDGSLLITGWCRFRLSDCKKRCLM